ncbi:MAG: sigma-70 family RNA polymerase sigma factor [Archangium sp.]
MTEARSAFEKHVVPRVRSGLQRAGAVDAEVDELVQDALTRVLVENSGERLKQYRGQGTFAAFVVTVAMRLFSTRRGKSSREAPGAAAETLDALPMALDLEKHLSRAQNRSHFAAAFQAALESLDPRQRTLLKMNLVNGSSIDELAPMYQVSRASVARWIAQAREQLRVETLKRLAGSTRMERDDLDGLMASLESGFDVSLRRFIADAGHEEK